MRSTTEWRYWGKLDPLHAVAGWQGREIGGPNPWTAETFLKLGRQDFADVVRHWNHYGRLSAGVCLEIGCGSGRMTAALLDAFDRVHALDVSDDQIQMARRLLGDQVDRVEFECVDSPASVLPDESCMGMFSSHVFQHLSEFGGVCSYLRETYRALVPGATACFHLPVPGAHRSEYPAWWRSRLDLAKVRLRRSFGFLAVMEYHKYPVTKVFDVLAAIGFVDLEVRLFPMSSNGDPHSFFFARKPARL